MNLYSLDLLQLSVNARTIKPVIRFSFCHGLGASYPIHFFFEFTLANIMRSIVWTMHFKQIQPSANYSIIINMHAVTHDICPTVFENFVNTIKSQRNSCTPLKNLDQNICLINKLKSFQSGLQTFIDPQ